MSDSSFHGASGIPGWRARAVSSVSACALIECLAFAYVAVVFPALDGFYAIDRFRAIGVNVQGHLGPAEVLRQAVFILEYAFAVVMLYAATRLGRWRSTGVLALFVPLLTLDLAAHAIYGRPAGIGNISALNASATMLGAALQEYGSIIAAAAGKALLLVAPLVVKAWIGHERRWSFVCPLLLAAALTAMYGTILVKRGPPALIGFPKGFSYALGSVYLKLNDVIGRPRRVPAQPMTAPEYPDIRNVVVVVDESVEYGYFSRVLDAGKSRYADFGLAYSGANCSAASNYILRKALWSRSDRGRLGIARTDSLFALARRAGYVVTYIDNQGVLSDPTTRNYIDAKELGDIDRVVENEGPPYERDATALQQIAVLARTGRNFIFVNKNGAHFPYPASVAPGRATGDRVADYTTSVRVNAADFLLALQDAVPADTMVFYTSDHGQSLTTRATHCNTGAETTAQEFRVPFLVLATNPGPAQQLQQAAALQRGRLTHLEFSESVRRVLGYRIPGMGSIFDARPAQAGFCGLYGSPKVFFGMLPECRVLVR